MTRLTREAQNFIGSCCLNNNRLLPKLKIRELPVEQRIDLYNKARRLHKEKGWGSRRIATELGMDHHAVDGWIYERHKPHGKYRFPNLTPTKELSYVLGVRYGDMSLYKRKLNNFNLFQYSIGLEAVDKSFVDKFNECLSKILLKTEKIPTKRTKGRYYRVRVNNRLLYEFLDSPLEIHKQVIDAFPTDFLRGFFDSEGGAYAYRRKNQWDQTIRVCNSNLAIIEYVRDLLRTCFLISTFITTQERAPYKKSYKLIIGSQKNLVKFYQNIGFSIARKQEVLAEIAKRANQEVF